MTNSGLFKTTIIIWSEYDTSEVTLQNLAYEAEEGDAYCSRSDCEHVGDPWQDEYPPSEEFFWEVAEELDKVSTDAPECSFKGDK